MFHHTRLKFDKDVIYDPIALTRHIHCEDCHRFLFSFQIVEMY